MIPFLRCHARTFAIAGLLCLLIAVRCSVPAPVQAAEMLPPATPAAATPPCLRSVSRTVATTAAPPPARAPPVFSEPILKR